MKQDKQDGLVPIQAIPQDLKTEVEKLQARCEQEEGLHLILNLEPPERTNEINQFLYYQDGRLVGFISLEGPQQPEATGMVHPGYRRRGIGTALFEAAKAESQRRGQKKMFLVCEEASQTGQAFSESLNTQYRHSEYAMQLEEHDLRRPQSAPKPLQRRIATRQDLEILTTILAAAFHDDENDTREQVARELQAQHERSQFYLWEQDSRAIGCLKVTRIEKEGYIHAFGVLPAWQGRGYGRQILQEAAAILFEEKHAMVKLEVETDNQAALSLYQSCGFKLVTSYRYYRVLL